MPARDDNGLVLRGEVCRSCRTGKSGNASQHDQIQALHCEPENACHFRWLFSRGQLSSTTLSTPRAGVGTSMSSSPRDEQAFASIYGLFDEQDRSVGPARSRPGDMRQLHLVSMCFRASAALPTGHLHANRSKDIHGGFRRPCWPLAAWRWRRTRNYEKPVRLLKRPCRGRQGRSTRPAPGS